MRITNRKLSDVDPPVWRAYPGVSVLYDNPGTGVLGGLEPLERLHRAGHPEQALYRYLGILAEGFATAARTVGLELSLLPVETYHVTLCDGPNEGSRAAVPPHLRLEVDETLAALPDSLLWSNQLMRRVGDPELRASVWMDPVTYRVAGIEVRGHAVVARLQAVGARSSSAKAQHGAARDEFVSRLQARWGVEVQGWRPHVTLGYLASEDDAGRTRDTLLGGWQASARSRLQGATITFRSASVYGFTDMVSFWRMPH